MWPAPGRMTNAPWARCAAAAWALAVVHIGSLVPVVSRVGVLMPSRTGVKSGRPRLSHRMAAYIPRRSARRNASATIAAPSGSVVRACGPSSASTSGLTTDRGPAIRYSAASRAIRRRSAEVGPWTGAPIAVTLRHHLQIFGNLGVEGVRLTELAARAQLSLAATSELVSELQELGYLERRPDGTDKRAKLIFPTPRGRQALDDAGNRVADIELHWSQIVGPVRFADTCHTLQQLLDTLSGGTANP